MNLLSACVLWHLPSMSTNILPKTACNCSSVGYPDFPGLLAQLGWLTEVVTLQVDKADLIANISPIHVHFKRQQLAAAICLIYPR